MGHPSRTTRGYTLVEVLVVMTIVGVLAIAGVSMFSNRHAASVRSILDEVEGSIVNARMAALATGRDMALTTWGSWPNGGANALYMAYGDASLTDANIHDIALGTVLPSAVAYGPTVGTPFHYLSGDPAHLRAEIVAATSSDAGDWATVAGTASQGTNQDITAVDPFKSGDLLAGTVVAANNLFNYGYTRLTISGSNQHFVIGNTNQTFIIQVVGTPALPGGPMGLIILQQNSNAIYKFYNPGVREGNGKWQRI